MNGREAAPTISGWAVEPSTLTERTTTPAGRFSAGVASVPARGSPFGGADGGWGAARSTRWLSMIKGDGWASADVAKRASAKASPTARAGHVLCVMNFPSGLAAPMDAASPPFV